MLLIAYCTIADVRNLTGLDTSDASDSVISGIMSHAYAKLNADIEVLNEDERVLYISEEKENDINGSNTTFYCKNTWLGDSTDDGLVSTSDVYVYKLDANSTRTALTVASIDDTRLGKFTLSSAPSSTDNVFVTYKSSFVDMETPNKMVTLAVCQLTAALAFTRLDAGQVHGFRVGKVALSRPSDAFNIYLQQYYRTVGEINRQPVCYTDSDDVYV